MSDNVLIQDTVRHRYTCTLGVVQDNQCPTRLDSDTVRRAVLPTRNGTVRINRTAHCRVRIS
jgi:hypothetical protein